MTQPRLALEHAWQHAEFFSSVVALLRGPAAPKHFDGDAYFRECWIDSKFPKLAFAAAIALQALLVAFPPPIWDIRAASPLAAMPRNELSWYGPIQDFPVLMPAAHAPKAAPIRPAVRHEEEPELQAAKGADAFHARQTILSEPPHPTHPRQTLIQPMAPPEPPKILSALPNIVQLASAQPARPKLQLTAHELTSLRPKAPATLAVANDAAPEISAREKQIGAIQIASSADSPQKPMLPVNPMSAPRSGGQTVEASAAAPEIAGRPVGDTLIALSATPAPVAPPAALPAGNLAARVSISPGGAGSGAPATSVPAGGAAHGPEGIFISGGTGASPSPISGLGNGQSVREMGAASPTLGTLRVRNLPHQSNSAAEMTEGANQAVPKLGAEPEKILGAKRVYTLHVNMPNLTSASGSWILNFAELSDAQPSEPANSAKSDLAGPVPVRKVDPKYPPELRSSHVDGEVVLYAIIRKDGSVDSIQLVRSVDTNLDENAMEALAQWKFVPAEKHGEPVDLEAVVHIPFRSRIPSY